MKVIVRKTGLSSIPAQLLVLPMVVAKENGKFLPKCERELRALDKQFSGEITRQIKLQEYKAGAGKRLSVMVSQGTKLPVIRTIRLSGVGSEVDAKKNTQPDVWRKLGGDLYRQAKSTKAAQVALSLETTNISSHDKILQAVLEGAYLARYDYDKYKSKKTSAPQKIFQTLTIISQALTPRTAQLAQKQAEIIASAVCSARDLVNCPPSDLSPAQLVREAKRMAQGKGKKRLPLKVFNKKALERLGAGALLAVARGSAKDPYLLHLQFKPKRSRKRVILIGKGITFDSGGLSIKPGTGMEDMKCDMAGAAAVLSVMQALRQLDGANAVHHEVHGIIPIAENMVNEDSVKPGDVVWAMNNKSIEILNTDAEGRLILADALCYAKKLSGDVIIDLATLTGACVVALGSDYAGLFSNSEELTNALRKSGDEQGERLWPLPLASEYRGLMDSKIANIKNIGPGGPGAIIGALFLKDFVPEKVAWAHLDIAGPAFLKKDTDYSSFGGTGFGVRTLISYLQNL